MGWISCKRQRNAINRSFAVNLTSTNMRYGGCGFIHCSVLAMKISHKIPALLVGSVVATSITFLGASFMIEKSNKLIAYQESMIALSKQTAVDLTHQFDNMQIDVALLQKNPLIAQSIKDFTSSWQELGDRAAPYLKDAYIDKNPYPAGEKEKLPNANDGSAYSAIHAKYHPFFLEYLQRRGYYDVFLVNKAGDVAYTVFKESDFATNLLNGQWKETDLAKVFRETQQSSPTDNQITVTSFAPYKPSNDYPAGFMGTAIFDAAGNYAGALIVQLNPKSAQKNLNDASKAVKGIELYLLGPDHVIHGDMEGEKAINPMEKSAVIDGLIGRVQDKTFIQKVAGHEEETVTFANSPVKVYGTDYKLVAEKDYAILQKELQALLIKLGIVLLCALGPIAFAGILISRRMTQPMRTITGALNDLRAGRKDHAIPCQERTDEIGEIAKAAEALRLTSCEADQLAAAQAAEQRIKEARSTKVNTLLEAFESKLTQAVGTVASTATQLYQTTDTVNNVVREVNNQTENAALASSETSQSVQTVAAAAEEMSASIQEISGQVAKASAVVSEAVRSTDALDTITKTLGDATTKISEVTGLISHIAQEINLLALNATIESARAGEAGKGFAVVATEVKNLAAQTANATHEVDEQIKGVQSAAAQVMTVLASIKDTILSINEYTGSIASAVEEQSAVTHEISGTMARSASGVQTISENINGVRTATGEADSSARSLRDAAKALNEEAESLTREVRQFLNEIRAA
jgi:methyl-accepting chemotaxis protein